MTPHIFRMPLDKKHCRAHTHVAGNEKRKSLAPVNRSGYLLLVFFTHIFVCLYFSYWVKQVGLHDSEWGGDDERGGKKSARCRTGSSHSVDTPCSIPGEGGEGRRRARISVSCKGSFSCLYLASRMHTIHARKKGKRRVTATEGFELLAGVGPETTKAKRGFDGFIHARKVLHILHDTE